MAITKQTRQRMEDLVYSVFDELDPTGSNTAKYKELFGKMSDVQFDKFFKDFFNNEEQYLVLDVIDYELNLQIEDVERAAKVLDVPLFEKVVMPFVNNSIESPVVTQYEVPVGYIHIKRVQQILTKKNSTSTEISTRSAITGQVVGKDKNARDSDQENFALVTLDAQNTLRELMGPRSDDMVMKNQMYSSIAHKGYVSLDELTNDVVNKTTLNSVDVHLIGLGIKSDLITQGLLVKKTIK